MTRMSALGHKRTNLRTTNYVCFGGWSGHDLAERE